MASSRTELGPKCGNPTCKERSPTNLLLCTGCKHAQYCSNDCQKQDWINHKTFCKHVSTNGASSKSLDNVTYHVKVAAHDPKAKSMARDFGITIPTSHSEFRGLYLLLRRLVLTGKDTPENLSLFFGQDKTIQQDRKNVRLEILLQPPHGSPLYASSKADKNFPPLEPSAAEVKEIEEIRALQVVIRSHVGARRLEDITTDDMCDILVKHFGDEWDDKLKIYQVALHSMDYGIVF
ncbi:hypothetical protein F4820DRAFT_446055 [Hypoxylon rubiginosum]|uniref:Uncharacterized protein n=1 Tax=Hypoxylon rubiginosum TaxID=110542 RepID=A0ACB9Z8W1_9PEZI|nr:hypothetical protein F4820DRAFT_446055 [Hypoxylon rubiginosum]